MFWGYLSVHVRYLPNQFFFFGGGRLYTLTFLSILVLKNDPHSAGIVGCRANFLIIIIIIIIIIINFINVSNLHS